MAADPARRPLPALRPRLLGERRRTREDGIAEVERRAADYGLPPLVWPDPFPGNTLFAMRAATFAKQTGRTVSFALAAFRQAFAAGRDLTEPDNVLIAAAACELHPRAVLRRPAPTAVKGALREATERGRRARACSASPRWSSTARSSGATTGSRRRSRQPLTMGGYGGRGHELRRKVNRRWPILPDAATCYELLARMALIRRFEEEAGRQYQRAKAGGFLHLAIGEEATIVGTTSVMREEDYLIGTYRTHGHAIARGTDPKRVMAELFGRVDGTSGGRGGSMHIFDRERRFMGGYGIVGGNLPIAAGLALASEYKGEDAVTVCMFGDGASNTGNFGETMNLAALWKLPVFFLVENNLYGMGTSVERHSAQTDLSKKAEGYGIPGERIDGMDVIAVREGVAEGIRQAREDRRPTLLEAFTYRYRGHSAADPEVYREREEVEEWREKDPIETFARRCVEAGVLGEREVQEVRDKAEEG